MFRHRFHITLNNLVILAQMMTTVLVAAVLLSLVREANDNGLLKICSFIQPSNAAAISYPAGQYSPQNNNWFPVPEWLAGTWEAKSELVVDAYDYRSHTHTIDSPTQIDLERQSVIGMQKDNVGRIWYYAGTPYVRRIETHDFDEYQQMERVSLVNGDSMEVTVNCLATVTRIAKSNNEIQQVYREETIATYYPLSADTLRARYVINDYDTQGRPISSSQAYCTQNRRKQFESVDCDERGDLRQEFQRFLVDNGLSNLLANK